MLRQLLLDLLKCRIETRILACLTGELPRQFGEFIQLLLQPLLHGVKSLLLGLIELLQGCLIDVLGVFENALLPLRQIGHRIGGLLQLLTQCIHGATTGLLTHILQSTHHGLQGFEQLFCQLLGAGQVALG